MGVKSFREQLETWRHDLHKQPEVAFNEFKTAAYLAKTLREMGFEVEENVGQTGVVATLKVGTGGHVVGLRSDIDALQIKEQGTVSYKSCHEGYMHGCGHDGHMASLLGAAKLLSDNRDFDGTVCLVFQPAEEPGKGAQAMLDDGLLNRYKIEEIYGFHNMPGMAKGVIFTRTGGIMGSEDNFVITVKGRGCHAARPHMGKDAILIGSEIVVALQTIVSRSIDPNEPVVISCTEFITDGAHNAVAGTVTIKGDTRSYSREVQAQLEQEMKAISEGICQMHGVTCEFEYTHEFLPTVNHQDALETAIAAATKVVGTEYVNGNASQVMISEDFGKFLEQIPGCFVFIGSGTGENGEGEFALHNPRYDFNDNILETAAQYFAEVAKESLAKLNKRIGEQ